MQRRGLKPPILHQHGWGLPSPLMQRRGLKQLLVGWCRQQFRSPLMQRRGLKQANRPEKGNKEMSPLMQRRGLKQSMKVADLGDALVASHAEAWIETKKIGLKRAINRCRLSCRGVD